jgi:glycerol-3-phosphate dehydrogenase
VPVRGRRLFRRHPLDVNPHPLFAPDTPDHCDLLVVGGGINGAGIARDAAGRGLSVVLCEKDDLASHTSSASTKLIHGGLRYLEHFDFGLVRKALQEREALMRSAPHIMWPLRFVMPHDASMRPVWMIRTGLWLYDHLARREWLPGCETLSLREHPAGVPLKASFDRAFAYSDGWVDDARLVVLCARDAADRGATVLTRTKLVQASPEQNGWSVRLQATDGGTRTLRARSLVNAAGPWALDLLRSGLGGNSRRTLKLIRGSHIVVPRRFEHPMAYLFQSPDRRVAFAIPYESDFTLIGTTDVEHRGDPGEVRASSEEIDYLCTLANRYFASPVSPADVIWSYAGVRPLLDDASGEPSAITRDYELELLERPALLMNVWGGKITTFRRLAEEVVDRLAPRLGSRARAWTRAAVLPGGMISGSTRPAFRPDQDFGRFVEQQALLRPWLPATLLVRWCRQYGSRIDQIVGQATRLEDLGERLAPDVFDAELDYLVRQEWTCAVEDFAWRRTKMGLRLDPGAMGRIGSRIQTLKNVRC